MDTDEISRRAHRRRRVRRSRRLREAFGARYIGADGALDRAAMRELAFEDPAARARLEAILHPAIREAAERALAAARGAYALVVVPLLFETRGYLDRVARTLVVDCPEDLQVERTVARSGLAPAQRARASWPRSGRAGGACRRPTTWSGTAAARKRSARSANASHARYANLQNLRRRVVNAATLPHNPAQPTAGP